MPKTRVAIYGRVRLSYYLLRRYDRRLFLHTALLFLREDGRLCWAVVDPYR